MGKTNHSRNRTQHYTQQNFLMREGRTRQITNRLPVNVNVSIVLTDPWHRRLQSLEFESRRQCDMRITVGIMCAAPFKGHMLSLMTQVGVNTIYSVKGFSQALWSSDIVLRGIKQTVPSNN